MSGRYERVNAHDEDDVDSPVDARNRLGPIPNSPPPSFHSSSLLSHKKPPGRSRPRRCL
ncbi:hypothetical protein NW754_007261 [Fusarium falciforme]|nr:hypothetical protein NW754_007261 [Fusarium falciforme]